MRELRTDSRSAKAAEALREMALQLGAGGKLPTVRELKSKLEVSLATLDTALQQLEREGLIRRLHGSGIYVDDRVNIARVVVLIEPNSFFGKGGSPFWPMMVEALRSVGSQSGLQMSCQMVLDGSYSHSAEGYDPEGIPPALYQELRANRVSGIIALGIPRGILNVFESKKIPVVGFAGYAPHLVMIDFPDILRSGIKQAMRRGCSQVHVGSIHVTDWRVIESIGAEAGVSRIVPLVPVDWVSNKLLPRGVNVVQMGFDAAKNLRLNPANPPSLVSDDDWFSQGLLMGLLDEGFHPGLHFHLFTHANKGSATLLGWESSITQAVVDLVDVSRMAIQLLARLIDGRDPLSGIPESQVRTSSSVVRILCPPAAVRYPARGGEASSST